MYSANLIGKQMDTEFGLYLPEYSIPAPEVQTNYKEIPFRDGAIDKTSPDGVVHYKDREWDLTFKKTGATVSASDLAALAMSVMNAIHGKAGEIIFDDDPNYKWVGRVFVTSVDCENNGLLIVNIHMITHPYKYSLADIVVVDEIQTTSDEYEGSIVSLTGGIGKSITELLVSFSPIQDLHGYANPWPGGGGKNLFQTTATSKTESGVTWTVNEDGSITATGTATWVTTILAGAASVDASMGNVAISLDGTNMETNISINYVRLYDANGNQLAVIIAGGLSVTQTVFDLSQYADAAEIRVSLKRNNNVATNGTVHIQVEKGTSYTDWTPYSNICPISGLTGLSVYVSPTQDPDDATEYTEDWSAQAGTVYHGTVDVVSGELTVDMVNIQSYNGETISEPWLSSMDAYAAGTTPTIGAQVVYTLATPLTYQLTPQEIALLVGTNNIWSTGDSVSVTLSTMDKVTLVNHGKPMNPKINVVSEGSISLLFEIDGTRYTATLSAGEYTLPDLVLFDGSTDVYEAGEGTITYTYPEVSL